MNMSPFGNRGYKSRAAATPLPLDATLTDFSAGLNLVDSDTSLSTNSAKVLKNMHRDSDGGMSMRWGTKFMFDVSQVVGGDIVEIIDFAGFFVVFTSTGEAAKVSLSTDPVAIWNTTIAAALVGSPTGWVGTTRYIDYTDFKNQLVVCNARDKPILIDDDLTVDYLQDIPTGSNVNVPTGKFCTTVGNYVVIAGIETSPDDIYISAQGTSGTWPGDPAPNDAVSLNVATYAPQANGNIRGLSSFRNFLLVHFAGLTIPLQLGVYDADGNHTPTVADTIPDYGLISHRMVIPLAQEIVFADERGVYSAKRNLFGGALEPSFLSQKITPAYSTDAVDDGSVDRQRTSFAVYNRLEQRIMFFLQRGDVFGAYVFSFVEGLKKAAWSTFSGMNFTCGCVTTQNKVFFANGTKVYQYGNNVFEDEDYSADLIDESGGAWFTSTLYHVDDKRTYGETVYICLTTHTSGNFQEDFANGYWEEYFGDPIEFDWEMPWSDINSRMKKKKITDVHFDTEGIGIFTCDVYVDNLYRNKLTNERVPALEMQFVAGDSTGFGGNGAQPYGGGRRTSDERLFGFPVEFKLAKLRMHGTTRGRLKFSTISILYIRGKYHR